MRQLHYITIDHVQTAINEAIEQAKKSTCLEARCGAIIISNGKVIGRGFNSPPGNLESQRRCSIDKSEYDEKVTDKTCCIHAEQRAILDAVENYGSKSLRNYSVLYFMRVDNEDNPIPSGEPYCTICSKLALDMGIKNWILQHDDGFYIYDAKEYNDLSFNYGKN
jgi:deoxycytidylate deaminase